MGLPEEVLLKKKLKKVHEPKAAEVGNCWQILNFDISPKPKPVEATLYEKSFLANFRFFAREQGHILHQTTQVGFKGQTSSYDWLLACTAAKLKNSATIWQYRTLDLWIRRNMLYHCTMDFLVAYRALDTYET